MVTAISRAGLNKCLSKAVAFKNAGKDKQAKEWGKELVKMLKEEGLID